MSHTIEITPPEFVPTGWDYVCTVVPPPSRTSLMRVDIFRRESDSDTFGWRGSATRDTLTKFSMDELKTHASRSSERKAPGGFWPVLLKYITHGVTKGETMADKMSKLGPWEMYEQMLDAHASRILSYGPPGLGKSYSPAKWAKENHAHYIGITLTDQTPMSELRGHFILKGNEFVWHDGCVARAWRKSHEGLSVLVLNEINEAGTDVETFLHNVLDDPEFARLDLPNNETVRPDAGNMITVATMNGEPHHLREALRDRFPVRIEVNSVHPDAIKALPRDLRPIATRMTSTEAGKARMSIRPFVAFASLRSIVSPIVAAQAVFGDGAHDIIAALALGEGA